MILFKEVTDNEEVKANIVDVLNDGLNKVNPDHMLKARKVMYQNTKNELHILLDSFSDISSYTIKIDLNNNTIINNEIEELSKEEQKVIKDFVKGLN